MKANKSSYEKGYQSGDISLKGIIAVSAGAVVLLLAIIIFTLSYFTYSKESMIYEKVLQPPSQKLEDLQAREAKNLSGYGVVDSVQGIYHIPIDKAMESIAQEARSQ